MFIQKPLHKYIHNCQKLEATQISLMREWMTILALKYYSAIETWTGLEDIVLRERS